MRDREDPDSFSKAFLLEGKERDGGRERSARRSDRGRDVRSGERQEARQFDQ